jgi:PAS domain S-box-containing protein
MPITSITHTILAGMCFFSFIIHFIIGLRRPIDKINLSFSLLSLCAALYIGNVALVQICYEIDSFVEYERLGVSFQVFYWIFFVLFFSYLTEVRKVYTSISIFLLCLFVFISNAFAKYSIIYYGIYGLKSTLTPLGDRILTLDATINPLLYLLYFISLSCFCFAFYQVYYSTRLRVKMKIICFLSLAFYFLTLLNDLCIELQLYSFMYIGSYGCIGFLLLMSLNLILSMNDFEQQIHMQTSDMQKADLLHINQSLQDNEERLKEAEKIAQLGHWEIDLIQNTIDWSDQTYKIFDIDPTEQTLTRDIFYEYVHPDDREHVANTFKHSLQEKNPYSIDHRIFLKNGTIKHVHEQCNFYFDDKGNSIRAIGTVQDITQRKLAEEELFEATIRQSEIVRATNIGLWDWNLKTNEVHYSKEWKKQIGYEDHEIKDVFDEWQNRVHPDDLQPTLEKVHQFISQASRFFRVEFRFRHKDGSYRWILAQSSTIVDESGEPIRAFGSHLDITDRKNAEQALQESEELFRNVIDHIASGIAVYQVVGDGDDFIFKDINPTGARIGQKTREEHFGRSVTDVYPGVKEMGIFDAIQRVWKTGNPERFPLHQYQDNKLHIWVENYIFKIPTGEVVAVYDDVTEQKQAEIAQKESEKRFRTLFEQAGDSIFLATMDAKLINVNQRACDSLGYTRSELLALSITDIDGIHNTQHDIQTLFQSLSPESPITFESIHQRKDGSTFPVEVRVGLLDMDNNQFVLGLARDITSRKKAEEENLRLETQLRQVQKMEAIGTLAGGIAHDFNNILFSIQGYLELLSDDLPTDHASQEWIAELFTATDRAQNLVRQILTFSRQNETKRQNIQLNLVVKEVAKLIKSSTPTTIEISTNIPTEGLTIKADPTQIHQVLMNLCTNAIYAMRDPGGELEIDLNTIELHSHHVNKIIDSLKEGTYAQITVQDTGPGIPQEIIDRIFEPFFTTKPESEGTGMGLAVVHGIVKSHYGNIRVTSTPGQGTCFTIILPISQDHTDESLPLSATALPSSLQGTVLVVDDEKKIVELSEKRLHKVGMNVVGITDSLEAWKVFQKNPDEFDIVITDHTMPNLTGFELAKKMLELRPDIPIILCTGYSLQIDQEMTQEVGIRKFVTKPVSRDTLITIISEILSTK